MGAFNIDLYVGIKTEKLAEIESKLLSAAISLLDSQNHDVQYQSACILWLLSRNGKPSKLTILLLLTTSYRQI